MYIRGLLQLLQIEQAFGIMNVFCTQEDTNFCTKVQFFNGQPPRVLIFGKLNQKFFFLKFGFNLPNFTTLGGCPLKNWTFVQKLVS